MKIGRVSFGLFCISLALLISACSRAIGPALANASGEIAHILTRYDDGHTISCDLESGRLLWAGSAASDISSVVIQVGSASYTLVAAELKTPMPGDKWVAFVLKKEGIQKVRFEEARHAADVH